MTKKIEFWNGKNLAGKSYVGAKSLISQGPRSSPTQAKYDVGSDTLSGTDLQPSAVASEQTAKQGG